jgi:hypothetical protein
MKTHTPEPWEILTTNGKTYVVTNALSQPFVGQVIAGPTTCPDWESNAILIASAPDLLAALELIYSNAGESPEWIRSRIGPAIAKAKGNE